MPAALGQASPGEVLSRSREFSGFVLKELVYPPGLELPAHAHDRGNFCMAVSGGCGELYGGRERDYEPLTLDYLPPGHLHSLKVKRGGMRSFSLEVAPHWLDLARDYSLPADLSVHSRGGPLSELLLRLYREFREADEASPLAVEGLALEMLAEASRRHAAARDRTPPPWLRRAHATLRDQFRQNVGLSGLAREAGVHPAHLAREFRRHYGCSVGEYQRRLRVEHACSLLLAPEARLTDVAAAAGFSDQSHFTRLFKRHKGVPPARYRAEMRSR